MALPPINATFNLERSLLNAREQTNDLQRQLATGKRATTYGSLGELRGIDLSFRGERAQIKGYVNTIQQVKIRMDVTNHTLERVREISAETKEDALGSLFNPKDNDQTSFQEASKAKFAEMAALLDIQVAGRFLFGGRVTDQQPMVSPTDVLEGTPGKAGFLQVADERVQADVGASGLGRLVIPAPGGAVVTATEDNATSPFGLKHNTVSSNLTGTTVAGPAGSPAGVTVTFTATLPQDGETVNFAFTLPDGTTTNLELKAVSGTPVEPNEFQIGADENATATNFHTVLTNRITYLANTELRAASLMEAADNFFDYDVGTEPQRVNGPPYNTATSLVDATTANTIYWYQGEISNSAARESARARIDDTITLNHGLRANESAFKTILKSLAAISADTYPDSDADSHDRYLSLSRRVNTELTFLGNVQSIDDINAEFTVIQATLGKAEERHVNNTHLLDAFIDDIEVVDTYEVSAKLLTLQTRLEASLSVTATIRRVTLVNYL